MTGAGKRKERWTLERPTTPADNSVGESVPKFTAVHDVYCAVRTLTDTETVRARTVERQTTHRVTIPYRDDMQTTWRLSRQTRSGITRILNITGMRDPDSMRRELELSCAEVASG
jgi:SPP1 family predicted phage head-tail adaptor